MVLRCASPTVRQQPWGSKSIRFCGACTGQAGGFDAESKRFEGTGKVILSNGRTNAGTNAASVEAGNIWKRWNSIYDFWAVADMTLFMESIQSPVPCLIMGLIRVCSFASCRNPFQPPTGCPASFPNARILTFNIHSLTVSSRTCLMSKLHIGSITVLQCWNFAGFTTWMNMILNMWMSTTGSSATNNVVLCINPDTLRVAARLDDRAQMRPE